MVTPVVNPGTFTLNLPVTNGQAVGTMTASGSPTTWSITAGNTGGAYAISNAGAITVAAAGNVAAGTVVMTVQACTAIDPNFANCVLLLGYEGANGSTGAPGWTDESPAAHGTAQIGGAASITTAQFKFGTSSGWWQIGGAPSPGAARFSPSSSWALGSAPFTLETWIRVNSLPASDAQLMGMISPGLFGWYLHIDSTGHLVWTVSTTGSNLLADISYAWSPTLATWYFITVDYDGTKYRMYVNGVMVASSTTARAIFDSADFLGLGCNSIATGLFFDGWLDETRITKGVARYATDTSFAVPAAAFPRSGPGGVACGSGTATITVNAAIPAGQTFNVTCPVTVGQSVGTVTANGSPTSFTIVSGNYFGFYAINNSGVLSVANADGICGTSATLGIRATYANGTSTQSVLVGIQTAPGPAQYLLLVPHYIGGVELLAGTVVTEGVQIPVDWVPTLAVDPQNVWAIQAFWEAGPCRGAEPNLDLYWSAPPFQQAAVSWHMVGPGTYQLTGAGASLGAKTNA